MNRILKSMIITGMMALFIVTACNLSAAQPTAATAVTAAWTATPPPPAATATEFVPLPSPTSEFAPFCDAESANALPQCQFPVVKESSVFCSQKNPYNLLLINQGMTYEVSDEDFRCSDAGKKDDMQMLTCTGPMASKFEITVCDPACVVPTAQAENKKCPQDYNFNSLQGCCTQEVQVLSRNCMTFEFTTTTCKVDCSVYTTQKTCNKNSYACLWDIKGKVCYARK